MADPTLASGDPPSRRLRPQGLHGRIVLVVLVAMVGATAVFAWTAWTGFARLGGTLATERTLLGRSVADHLEYVVKADLEVLQGIGTSHPAEAAGHAAAEPAAVREAYLRSRALDAVLLLSDPATIVW